MSKETVHLVEISESASQLMACAITWSITWHDDKGNETMNKARYYKSRLDSDRPTTYHQHMIMEIVKYLSLLSTFLMPLILLRLDLFESKTNYPYFIDVDYMTSQLDYLESDIPDIPI
jgi:hypothetical protein